MIRPACSRDLPILSALCLRSKATWGYDAGFLAACRDELTLTEADLRTTRIGVSQTGATLVGMVQVGTCAQRAELHKLFVDPDAQACGHGARLLGWAARCARQDGARSMIIESDPGAEPFYLKHGARRVGLAASGSIPGRMLPLLELELQNPAGDMSA